MQPFPLPLGASLALAPFSPAASLPFQAGAHHVGILLQCSLWCRGSKVGPGIVRAFSREDPWEDGSPVGDAAKVSFCHSGAPGLVGFPG